MLKARLRIAPAQYELLREHLLPGAAREQDYSPEEAAFAFATTKFRENELVFTVQDWQPLTSSAFTHQSDYHLELSDETRASVIKRAHDLGSSLVEFHSHPGSFPAQFSHSDFTGLAEFVPHVWWRLSMRPYAAVVVAPSGIDGLAWVQSGTKAEQLIGIEVNGRLLKCTGRSWRSIQVS
jgi:hypothetical protein